MTTIFIRDTGYVTPGQETGTQLSGSTNIVNSGTTIPLKVNRIDFNFGINVDNTPTPATYANTQVNYVSFDNPTFVIAGTIKRKGDLSGDNNTLSKISSTSSFIDNEGSTSTDEVKLLELLYRLCKTKGYKELYYGDTTTSGGLLYAIGATDSYNATDRHVHIRCKGINIVEVSKETITWRLTCEMEALVE